MKTIKKKFYETHVVPVAVSFNSEGVLLQNTLDVIKLDGKYRESQVLKLLKSMFPDNTMLILDIKFKEVVYEITEEQFKKNSLTPHTIQGE